MKRKLTLAALFLTALGQAQISVCLGQPVTLAAPNPSSLSNLTYSVNPGGITSSTSVFQLTPTASVAYTIYTTGTDMSSNIVTTTTQTNVTVNGLPSFGLVSSPPNYTLGCSTKSVVEITFVNGQSAPPGGGPVSYTILVPGGGGPAPAVVLAPAYQYTFAQAGTYTAVTRDNTNLCDAKQVFNIVDNKIAPSIDSVSAPILNCSNTLVVLQVYAGISNVNFKWTIPPQNVMQNGSTLTVADNPMSPPSVTVAGNFTLTVEDNSNLCKTIQVVSVKRNFFPPQAHITVGGAGISCSQPTVVLSNSSTSGIPPGLFPITMPVVAILWEGPTTWTPTSPASTYIAANAGTYTLTVIDQNNGCVAKTSANVPDNVIYTQISNAGPVNLCGSSSTTIMPSYAGNVSGATYQWAAPSGANTGPTNGPNLGTASPGSYTVTITNLYGCQTSEVFDVVYCLGINKYTNSMPFSIYPNPGNGVFNVASKTDEILTLQVFDAKLTLVKEAKLIDQCVLDLGNQPAGIYFIKVYGQDRSTRILKE